MYKVCRGAKWKWILTGKCTSKSYVKLEIVIKYTYTYIIVTSKIERCDKGEGKMLPY